MVTKSETALSTLTGVNPSLVRREGTTLESDPQSGSWRGYSWGIVSMTVPLGG